MKMDRVIIGLDQKELQQSILELIPDENRFWFGLKRNCPKRDVENHYFYSDQFLKENQMRLVNISIPDTLQRSFQEKLPTYLNQFSRTRYGRDRLASENTQYLWLILKWFYDRFQERPIKWFFAGSPPHFAFDEILSDYMVWRNIPVFYACETLIANRFVVTDHDMNFISPAKNEEDLTIDIPEIYGEKIFYMENIKYYRLSKKKIIGWGLKHLLGLHKDTFLWTNYRIRCGKKYIDNINVTFEKSTGFVNLKKQVRGDYIYFALHMQPEMTTSGLGGDYVDQVLAIERLSHRLPEGWRILVKENPLQDFRHRNDAFFKRLLKIKNVVLIDRRASSRFLIENSQLVATISGTVGWESVRLKKAVIIFGWAWYKGLDGVYAFQELRDNLREISERKITNESLQLSFRKILMHFWPGCVEPGYLEIMSEQQKIDKDKSIAKLIFRLDELAEKY